MKDCADKPKIKDKFSLHMHTLVVQGMVFLAQFPECGLAGKQ